MSDVCLLLEGGYPGVGGVVTWIDLLISRLPTLTFSVVAFGHPHCGAPPGGSDPPPNVDEVIDILLPEDGDPALLPPDEVDMLAAAVPLATVHHVLSVGVASRVAARAAAIQGRPYLLTEHGIAWLEKGLGQRMNDSPEERASMSAVARRAAVRAYEHAAGITSVSRVGAAFQRALGAAPSRVLHVANPAPHPRKPSIPIISASAGPLIGLVGRVVGIKDIATFVRAAVLIADRLPTARFVVLGATHEDETYVLRCMEMARSVGLGSRLEFLGQTDVWAWYPALDVVVLTSRSEGQPFAVLEALTAGRPVVSTAAGDVPHLLAKAGPAGIVVPIGDASAVASSVVGVLQSAPSVDVKAAARRVVAELPPEHEHAATYGRIYELAVAGRTDVLATERVGAIPGSGNPL